MTINMTMLSYRFKLFFIFKVSFTYSLHFIQKCKSCFGRERGLKTLLPPKAISFKNIWLYLNIFQIKNTY